MNTLLSLATAVEERWLHEFFPEDLAAVPRVFYDAATKRVYAEEQLKFRDLAIGTPSRGPAPGGRRRGHAARAGSVGRPAHV